MIPTLRRHLLNRFVLRPTRNEVEFAPKERVLMRVDGMTDEFFTESSYRESEDRDAPNVRSPELLVLKFPGTAGRAERASDWPCGLLPDVNVRACTWNAPGYGGSTGRATLANIARRALRFHKLVTKKYASSDTKIWLVGNSLGCATATYLASRPDVHVSGLILRNPPPLIETFKRVARRYPLGRLTDAVAESLPPEMNLSLTARSAAIPAVMLQSEFDQLVPPELQMEVFDALPGPKRLVVLTGIGHDDLATEDHELEINQAVRWLWDQRSTSAD